MQPTERQVIEQYRHLVDNIDHDKDKYKDKFQKNLGKHN